MIRSSLRKVSCTRVRQRGHMAGRIRELLDNLIEVRAKGNPVLRATTKTKLILRGLNPDDYDSGSPDDPAVVAQVLDVARKMNVKLAGESQ